MSLASQPIPKFHLLNQISALPSSRRVVHRAFTTRKDERIVNERAKQATSYISDPRSPDPPRVLLCEQSSAVAGHECEEARAEVSSWVEATTGKLLVYDIQHEGGKGDVPSSIIPQRYTQNHNQQPHQKRLHTRSRRRIGMITQRENRTNQNPRSNKLIKKCRRRMNPLLWHRIEHTIHDLRWRLLVDACDVMDGVVVYTVRDTP